MKWWPDPSIHWEFLKLKILGQLTMEAKNTKIPKRRVEKKKQKQKQKQKEMLRTDC